VKTLLRRALGRHTYEGADMGVCYPEPWFITGHGGREFWWRFWLGRPMDGRRWSNATFWRSATSGEPSWWLRLAGWQRLALRLAGAHTMLIVLPLLTLTVLSGWWPELRSPLLTGALTVSALPLLLPLGALTAHKTIRSRGLVLPRWERSEQNSERSQDSEQNSERYDSERSEREQDGEREGEHASERSERSRSRFYERWTYAPLTLVEGSREWERSVVLPLARAVAPQIHRAYHPDTAPSWCIVPRDYAKPDGKPVRILLPAQFTGVDDRANRRLVRTIKTRLALDDMAPRWLLENTSSPALELHTPEAPPTFLSLADVLHHLEGAAEYEPFLGQVAGGRGLHIQMEGDGPHSAVAAGTGAGKTTLLKLLTCQFRAWGWLPVILDWKRSEANSWAWDLPGVRVLSDIEAIHDFGVQLSEEIDYRRNAHPDERAELPKLVIIRNEWNATAEMLMTWWQDYRATLEPAERAVLNPKSPALRGYANLVFCGRELGMFDVVEAQRLSARVFNGNADVRENYRNKVMARYTYSTVKMLVGDPAVIRTFPKAPKEIGRWTVMAGEDVHVAQVPYLTNDEARAFALSGKPAVASPWSVRRPGASVGTMQRTQVSATQGDQLPHEAASALAASPVPGMKLADLVPDVEHLGITLKVLRNARDGRDPNFPESCGGNTNTGLLYHPWEVIEWARRRHARMAAEGAGK
jgi:hypothetical protein